MRKALSFLILMQFCLFLPVFANKGAGEQCTTNEECDFQFQCKDGVCVKKKEWDFGSSDKAGNECNNDADCINSGKCVKNAFGMGYCSGN